MSKRNHHKQTKGQIRKSSAFKQPPQSGVMRILTLLLAIVLIACLVFAVILTLHAFSR